MSRLSDASTPQHGKQVQAKVGQMCTTRLLPYDFTIFLIRYNCKRILRWPFEIVMWILSLIWCIYQCIVTRGDQHDRREAGENEEGITEQIKSIILCHYMRVSMALTVSRKMAKNLVVRRKKLKMLTVRRKKS